VVPVAVALAAAGVAAGCNFIVGVGDYAAGEAGADFGDDGAEFSDDASDAMIAEGGGNDASMDATMSATVDAGADVQGLADADAGTDAPGSCSPANITSCAALSAGYACTGSATPWQGFDAAMACTLAPDGGPGGATGYCCVTSTCSLTLAEDGSVDICPQGPSWSIYSCYGSDMPQQDGVPLACELTPGACAGNGCCGSGSTYCCATPTCVKSTVTCSAGQTGYTCSGSDQPSDSIPNITCPQQSAPDYCCEPITCRLDPSVQCPISGSGFDSGAGQSGYSCAGQDNPEEDFPSVNFCFTGPSSVATSSACCFSACSTNADCQSSYGTVCFGYSCEPPSGAVGDPCGFGWPGCAAGETCTNDTSCTQSCTHNDTCGTNSAGLTNGCVGGTCLPGCSQNNDCAPYAGTVCVPVSAGASVSVCEVSPGQLGDSCSNSACATGTTCGYDPALAASACTTMCQSPTDTTTCGMNSQRIANLCVADPTGASDYVCVPGCVTDADCTPYLSRCSPSVGCSDGQCVAE
jgi:hypothetical protein